MKTLYLVRHAKSSWADGSLSDEQRPLLKEGISRTKKIIKFLKSKQAVPEVIFSSHAVRAVETARLFANGLDLHSSHIKIIDQIYYCDDEQLYHTLFSIPDNFKSVMIVGHNPTMTQLANRFMQEKVDFLPTSSVVCVQFDTKSWNEVPLASWESPWTVYPKMLE
jgi:phosphohistidine phosphatase